MQNSEDAIWETDMAQQLAATFAAINNAETMQKFLRDVMTEKEIIEIGTRLEAARMLEAGQSYVEVIQKTKLSSRTVARISDWMQNGRGGYMAAVDLLNTHPEHIPPAAAE
jgi:TrpR-related protein YerC/YecD